MPPKNHITFSPCYSFMTTLYEFVYDELDQPESIDIIGVGVSPDHAQNQWLYRMNRGFSEVEGVHSVVDYWLGLEDDPQDYDLRGDVLAGDFDTDQLDSETSLLVTPRPSIYRSENTDGGSYVANYKDLSDNVESLVDGVLMREVGRDFQNIPKKFDYDEIMSSFGFNYVNKKVPLDEFGNQEVANMLTHRDGILARGINWEPPTARNEEMVLVRKV